MYRETHIKLQDNKTLYIFCVNFTDICWHHNEIYTQKIN